ncbi:MULTISPECIES: phenylacetate--CoA ligase PaaK [unclassified Haladaptatus]|uniref:phenylacetate--CoA ligase PaaK n=1 Tax=unclassified Haladaptatus TaxID=2622732 RepID=UPI0023E783E4|nr:MULTISPECIES: phenylacetate--CoA ligase PaaK [unclassified Haladaptatus]
MYGVVESATRDELRDIQSDRLRNMVETAAGVPFYQQAFEEAGITAEDVESVEDIDKLPFTTKEDLRDNYPDKLFAVPRVDIVRLHASSGTTGKPKIVAYTRDDLDVWREVMARSLNAAGVSANDTVQNAYGYGLFTGGLGFHDGAEELGATVIPIGGGNTDRQIDFLQDLGSTVLSCTPSYCLYLAEALEERDVDPRDLPLSTVVIGAEPFTDPMRAEIEDALDVTAIDVYGLSEIVGPGVSIECAEAQDGLHVWEDYFYPEVVNPETGEVLDEGEEGELVLTTLSKQAMPVLRYRTGDITSLNYDECECGRTHVRMDNVTGRVDDLLIVRGVNVYPSQIEEAMLEFAEAAPHYRIDLRREGTLDTIELTVEHHADAENVEELREKIHEKLNSTLDVSLDELHVVEPGTIERTTVGKVKRVFDHRE